MSRKEQNKLGYTQEDYEEFLIDNSPVGNPQGNDLMDILIIALLMWSYNMPMERKND